MKSSTVRQATAGEDQPPKEGYGFAPGKLILCGEHAVVFGHVALAVAVDRGTEVIVRRRPGPSGVDDSVEEGTAGAPMPGPEDPRLAEAVRTLLPKRGLGVSIRSRLPIGRGMGSSAALAVALVRALASLEGRKADFRECHERGFAVERVFHGTPSGLDHAVSALGGGVRYRRVGDRPIVEPFDVPQLGMVVLDSGGPGDTGAMVAGVSARRPGIDGLLEEIGALAAEAERRLHEARDDSAAARALGPILTENHRLLRAIGVSNDRLDELVSLALQAGAHGAKLAGAGGGGVVLALAPDPDAILRVAARAGVPAFSVSVYPAEPGVVPNILLPPRLPTPPRPPDER